VGSTPLAPGLDIDFDALDDIARTVALVDLALRDAEIDDGDARRFVTDLVVTALDPLIDLIPYRTASFASVVLPYAVDGLEALGIVPPDAESVRAAAHRVMANRVVGAALIVIGVAITQMTIEGLLVAGTLPVLDLDELDDDCKAAAVRQRVVDFIEATDAGEDTKDALRAVLNSMLNAGETERLCNRR
jgi:hypothetical protein